MDQIKGKTIGDLTLINVSDKITPIYPIEVNKLNLNHFRVIDKVLKVQFHRYCTIDQETAQLLTKYNVKPELYRVDEMMGLLEVLNGLSSNNLKKVEFEYVSDGFKILYDNHFIGKIKYQSSDHIAEFNVVCCISMVSQLLNEIHHIEQAKNNSPTKRGPSLMA